MIELDTYDRIVVNSSAGKDSQAMLDWIVWLADCYGVRERLVVVHCDLGRVEWSGTRELAEEHAAHYGLRFEVVARERDLLHQVEHERGRWPSAAQRYCTSDQKTAQVAKLHTKLARELRAQGLARPARILDCLGLRRDESDQRCKKLDGFVDAHGEFFEPAKRASRNLVVDRWFPIADWTVEQVWDRIGDAGTRHHEAYDLGMSRLSCAFCVLASEADLRIAAEHNPELLAEYLRIEDATGHTFRHKRSLRDIVGATEKPGRVHLPVVKDARTQPVQLTFFQLVEACEAGRAPSSATVLADEREAPVAESLARSNGVTVTIIPSTTTKKNRRRAVA